MIERRDSLLQQGTSPTVRFLRGLVLAAVTFGAVTLLIALAALLTAD